MLRLKPAFVAVDSHVLRVVERASALLDGVVQHFVDRLEQSFACERIEPCRQAIVAQLCTMENLVGIDVADARDSVLIK